MSLNTQECKHLTAVAHVICASLDLMTPNIV